MATAISELIRLIEAGGGRIAAGRLGRARSGRAAGLEGLGARAAAATAATRVASASPSVAARASACAWAPSDPLPFAASTSRAIS